MTKINANILKIYNKFNKKHNMTKKINIRKVDGGVIMDINEESNTFTEVYVFSDSVYPEKRDKFHTPAGNKIFEQFDHFEISNSCSGCFTCDINRYSNGYYVTIKKNKKIIYEFVEEFEQVESSLRDKLNCKLFEVISKIINKEFEISKPNAYFASLEFEIKN
jgi:hypothetical protein